MNTHFTNNDHITINKKSALTALIAMLSVTIFFLFATDRPKTKNEQVSLKAGELAKTDLLCTELTLIPVKEYLKKESGNE